MTLTPAYGRDYTSKAKVLADWNGNKDFQIADIGYGGKVTSRDDLQSIHGSGRVMIRYDKMRKIIPANF